MTRYIIRRVLMMAPLLLGVSLIVFFLIHSAPGDPTAFFVPESEPDPQVRAAVAHDLGLDQPLPMQYVLWLRKAVTLDFGQSFRYQQPVMGLIMERIPATFQLQGLAILLALCLAVPVGLISALRSGSLVDRTATVTTLFGLSMPEFWSALMLLMIFSLALGWLPSTGMGQDKPFPERMLHYVLPVTVLALTYVAWYTRFVKTSMLEVVRQEYMTTARAKGLASQTVVIRHGLKNALIPLITIVGLSLPRLLGGSIIIESIFAWPGIGRLGLEAVLKRDYPVIMGLAIVTTVVILVLSLVIDIIYVMVDPRISFDSVRE
ncbi:MAG: ABC transporter permease [Anaerolineae bacterium]